MKHKYQTKKANNLYVAFLLLLSLSFSGYAQNLITNGSAENENGTAAQGVAIDDWTQISGDWQLDASSGLSSTFPTTPQEGSYYFNPGAVATSELTQTVDLTSYATDIDNGLISFLFTGYVRGYNGNDSSNIKLEYLNISDAVLSTFDSGNITATAWQTITNATIAPVNTRSVKITLTSIRNDGTGNDGYYDNLSLVKKDNFITTWQTTTDNESITIPVNTSYTYDYSIDWGDGSAVEENTTGEATHAYATAGTYTVAIIGDFPAIYFNNNTENAEKLTTIEQWGDIAWSSFASAFYGCSNVTLSTTDAPDLFSVTSMSSMFYGASAFNGDLSDWDTSGVTTMVAMFSEASAFNGDISGWNTSNVTNMSYMFYGASAFNGDISGWNTSNVTNMSFMFYGASVFNGDISDWDTFKVTSMKSMFVLASQFNQNLISSETSWDTSNVTDMGGMFSGASAFNGDISSWNTSKVTNMKAMLKNASSFNQDINNWNTSNVTDMNEMFSSATSFNQDLNDWDTSNVTDMYYMFGGATAFNGDISKWNIEKVTNIGYMFNRISAFNGDISKWNPASVTNMNGMFYENSSYNGDISGWNTSSVTNMSFMFYEASSFNQDLSTWDLSSVTNISNIFYFSGLNNNNYDTILVGWNANENTPDDLSLGIVSANYCNGEEARNNLTKATADGGKGWTIGDYGLECKYFTTTWTTTKNNESITIPVSTSYTYDYSIDWGDNTVEDHTGEATHTYETAGIYTVKIRRTFPAIYFPNDTTSAEKLTTIEDWGDIAWSSFYRAFWGCSNVTLTATDTPDLSSVTDMSYMFRGASAFNGDISGWDTSSVTDMSSMFSGASAFNRDISSWDTSSVTSMGSMFREASAFNQNLISSDTSWDTSSVTDMSYMFYQASAFNQDVSDWNLSSVTSLSGIFYDSGLSNYNYDKILIGWNANENTPDSLSLGTVTATYCEGETARANLVASTEDGGKGWTITDSGLECKYFITTWTTTTDSESITIPVSTDDYIYDYSIDWGDDTVENHTGEATHTYATAGTYTVKIRKFFPAIYFNNDTDNAEKLTTIEDWGGIAWSSFYKAFYGCSNVTLTATDVPDLSSVTNLSHMFAGASAFNGDISSWNTSSVTNMQGMFSGASAFNQDISFNEENSSWDTSSVENMSSMFYEASTFNHDVSGWNLSSVTSLSNIFYASGLSNYNYDKILIGWNANENTPDSLSLGTVSATYCDGETARANLVASTEDGGKGWTITDSGLDCKSFTTTWTTTTDSESITIPVESSSVYIYSYDYTVDWGDGTIEFNNTTDATHTYTTAGTYTVKIRGTFPAIDFSDDTEDNAKKLTTIEDWGDIAWSSFYSAFEGCSNVTLTATNAPDLSNVTNMTAMFSNASAFNGNISHWDTSNITQMGYMFREASKFNQDLSDWDTSNVRYMNYMFHKASEFNGDISSWNTSNVRSMSWMFYYASAFNGDISDWDTSKVTNMSYMFGRSAFNSDLSKWDTSSVTNMGSMFSVATVFNQDLSDWDTSNVTDMSSMFNIASSFNQDISDWDTSSVKDMGTMFNATYEFNQDISGWDFTSVTDMGNIFRLSGISNANYDKLLIAWDNNENISSSIDLETVPATYCNGETARANLVASTADGGKGWSIGDYGLDCDITWTGATDTNWSDKTNWSDEGVPTSSHTVTIPANLTNYPTTISEVSFNTMTMEAGTTFIPQARVTGTVTYNKSIPDTYGYFIASPVLGATIEGFILNSPLLSGKIDPSLVSLGTHNNDDSTPNWEYFTNTSTGIFTSGVGYTVKLSTASTVSFTGTVNHKDVSVPVTRGTESKHFLLGNPFTSNINSATFLSNNTEAIVDETMWTLEEGNYATYNKIKTLEVAPSEGFLVQLNEEDTASSVYFKADSRAHKANEASKQEATPYFELFIENQTNKKSTEVFYFSEATTGYDNGYDSEMFGGATYDFAVFTELVSDNEGQKLAIQTLPDNNTSAISVGIIAKAGEEITFSVEEVNLPEDSTVYLEDTLTGEFTNLSETTYKTTIKETSNGAGQFYIHTSAKSLSTEDIATAITNISVYKSSNQEITITGLNTEAIVSVYSLLGKEVVNTNITPNGVSTVSLPSLSAGVYIVKVSSTYGETIKKITLN